MNKVKLYLNYAGYCYARENHAIKGGRNQKIKFHALFGLICHPEKGWILFDTGYTKRFYDATAGFPNKFYALITKVVVTENDEVKTQLQHFGLTTADIKHIILSHFHADHIGGLKDFEQATVYCSRPAYQQLKTTNSFFGFTKGILKSLLPANLGKNIKFIEECGLPVKDEIFGVIYDLFHDGHILIYPLPGHAAGQVGILLRTDKHSYFLIADACWLKKSYQELILPHPIVKLFFSSWKDFKTTLTNIHRFHKAYPETIIVPTHCYETTSLLVANQSGINEL